jgi:hypothetical protein
MMSSARSRAWRRSAATALLAWGASTLSAQAPPDPAALLGRIGFTAREIGDVERGVAVARVLDTDNREIAVIGAVRINASPDPLAARFRQLDYLRGREAVLQLGTFGRVPSAADLQALRFEAYDLDVRDCRPGDCKVRLSAEDISRFTREVNWGAPDWATASAKIWRDVLSGYASGYVARGAAALPVFVNKEEALKVESERAILLRQLEVLEPCAPQLYRYVRTPAGGRPRGLEDLTYWAVEDFGVRPVMRVVHQAMYRAPGPDASLAIASSQIYAAHYLDAAENFVCALVRPGSSGREFYLISVNRARTRSLSGVLRAFARSTVRGRSRDAMEKILTSTKASLEAASR